jgi:hypothetical protein
MIRRIKNALIAGTATLSMSLSALFLTFAPVSAATGYTLFDDATLVSPGKDSATAAEMVSVSTADPFYGGVEFEYPDALTFAGLTELGTDFNVTDDNCGGGSPRFSVTVDQGGTEKNIFVYLGDAPNYNTCTPDTWVTSGDLLASGRLIDTSQLTGGTFYHEYDDAVNDFGALEIRGISLVTEGGWSQTDGEQTVLADNTVINQETFTYEAEETPMPESKDDCKKGKWQDYGEIFKNQGDCVSWVATNGRNPATGLVNF